MRSFRSEALEDLTRQLLFTPAHRRREHLDRIEELYWRVDPDRTYPWDYLVYQITSFRPASAEPTNIVGRAVRADLVSMGERLSDSLDEDIGDYDPPPLDVDAVCRRLGVSRKTVHRYRDHGLFARRLLWPDGRRRLGFREQTVERFVRDRWGTVEKAGRYSRLDEETRHEIVRRARRIAGRAEVSPFRVARFLAAKYGRSTETVRSLLLNHDREDPRVAIFPQHRPPLTDRQQRLVYRAFQRGVSVTAMARRCHKTRDAIYRAINQRRADALRALPLGYVPSPTFARVDAEQVILGADLPKEATSRPRRGSEPSGRSGEEVRVSRKAERDLFVRYNFVKYLAAKERQALDRHHPRAGALDRIETRLRHAAAIRRQLADLYHPVVASVARKHLGQRRVDPDRLAELCRVGERVLLEALESYDPSGRSRFSTYLRWSLMRRFAAEGEAAASGSAEPAAEAARASASSPAAPDGSDGAVRPLLDKLADRERHIVVRRFGLSDDSDAVPPRPLPEVAEELGVSAERVRQIERRAIRRLRRLAAEAGVDLSALTPL